MIARLARLGFAVYAYGYCVPMGWLVYWLTPKTWRDPQR